MIQINNSYYICTINLYLYIQLDQVGRPRPYSATYISIHAQAATKIHKIEVFCDLDLQSWRGEDQNEAYVANLHCSLGRLASVLENLVK